MSKTKKYVFPIVALVLANVLWGTNGFLIKMSVESIPVTVQASIRFIAAGLLLLPLAVRMWKPVGARDFIRLIASSILFVSISTAFLNYGLSLTTAGNVAAIHLLSPIVLCVLAVLVLKEKIQPKVIAGIGIAAVSAYIIVGQSWQLGSRDQFMGDMLAVLSMLTGALATIINKPLAKRINAIQLTCLTFLVGIIPLTLYALTQVSQWNIAETTQKSWIGLAGSIVVISLANVLFFYALRLKSVQSVSVYSYLMLPVAIIGAWIVIDERPTPLFLVGSALMIVGVYIVESRRVVRGRTYLFGEAKGQLRKYLS